jgi:hypothetical protein
LAVDVVGRGAAVFTGRGGRALAVRAVALAAGLALGVADAIATLGAGVTLGVAGAVSAGGATVAGALVGSAVLDGALAVGSLGRMNMNAAPTPPSARTARPAHSAVLVRRCCV